MFKLCIEFQNADYTTGQIYDLADKLEQSEAQLSRGSIMMSADSHDKKTEDKLSKAMKDGYVYFVVILFYRFGEKAVMKLKSCLDHSKSVVVLYLSSHFLYRCKTTMEAIHGLMSQVIKDRLFNQVKNNPIAPAPAAATSQEAAPITPAASPAAAPAPDDVKKAEGNSSPSTSSAPATDTKPEAVAN